ncbi:hypothetical protein [Bradyrhizobium sp. JYMT SZCCT0428]|uniref:hypothetical protein n=1 Tax=Bradyrhizobium sp. JYMT SZCCT0428 TaxID=2807673 RepID=UPI001BA6ACCD|nr:hypothetical protein [Bradyrhizobium sp. JYMT SZCCT0428]MBR1156864.1 hypothetical protein [Bradyrhizobium sp. JYMT SZCCT0428]
MSTSYRPAKTILAGRLFDGCLREFGIDEHVKADESFSGCRCLTDGLYFVWVNIVENNVSTFNSYGANDPTRIFEAVANVFQTEIFSEHQPQYWGFGTDHEWEAALEAMAIEDENRRREGLRKFLRGEPHELKLGTNELVQAEIAKLLILRDPEILLEQNEGWLEAEIRNIYSQNRSAFDDVPF